MKPPGATEPVYIVGCASGLAIPDRVFVRIDYAKTSGEEAACRAGRRQPRKLAFTLDREEVERLIVALSSARDSLDQFSR